MTATLELDGRLARLTLDRPDVLNALDQSTASALEAALGDLERASDVSVVIVSGRGRAFCAGNDIAEMPGLAAEAAEALSERWQRIVDRFARLPQVTIAAIRGHALGGGAMLAVAQDLRVAERGARLGLPEIGLGFTPSYGIARLFDVVGGAHARDLLLTGRIVDAEEALRLGLVNRVVPDGALDEATAAIAMAVAAHPRRALAATKRVIDQTRAGDPGTEARAFADALTGDPEARARIEAFVARRRPRP